MALKKINYNGQSKIILRLCEMVNQLIDGGGGGGSTVAYTQTLSSGTKTGEISIDGVSTDMYAPTQPTALSDLTNDEGFIDNTVNNLTNYYLKSETYTQSEVDALISAIVTLNILVVQTLPTQDISTTTIYLVPKQTAETQDIYDEYIYVNNAWELIGTTQIDLSNYYTKTETDALLANKVDKVAGKQLSTEDFTSALKTKLDGIASGAEVNVQSDWNQSDSSADDYIKNKPTIPDISNIPISGIGEFNESPSTSYPVITMNSGFNLKEGAYLSVKFNSTFTIPYSEPIHTYTPVLIDGTIYSMESYIGRVTIDAGKVAIIVYDGSHLEVVAVNNSSGTSYSEGDGIDITNDTISVDTTFTEASTRTNIASGETFATILGKIKKWFTDLPSMFVSKSDGGTFGGNVTIDKQNGSTSAIGQSELILGNNIAEGISKNSKGVLRIYGEGVYRGNIGATNLTANRNIELPNKSGTLALTSDIQDLKFPRQKNLGTFTTTAELEAFLSACNVSTGKFDGDIMIGDYMMIAGYECYVAGFDTEYNKGDTAMTAHHITCIANFGSSKMNETTTTAGGYEGAATMQAYLTARETELTNVAGTHIKTRRVLTTNTVTDGKSSGWAWTDHKLTLMTETQIYGSIQWGNVYDTGEGYEKLPIFNYLSPLQVFGRTHIWLRGVFSASNFCLAHGGGYPNGSGASYSRAAVALFCLG